MQKPPEFTEGTGGRSRKTPREKQADPRGERGTGVSNTNKLTTTKPGKISETIGGGTAGIRKKSVGRKLAGGGEKNVTAATGLTQGQLKAGRQRTSARVIKKKKKKKKREKNTSATCLS